MGDSYILILILVGILLSQQFFFLRQIQKLVDKLMSRSYHEYEKAKDKNIIKVQLPKEEIPDDLGPLSEFGM